MTTPVQIIEGPEQRLRLPEVLRFTGFSRPTLYRRIADGLFPKGIKDGRITAWSSRAVAEWQQTHA